MARHASFLFLLCCTKAFRPEKGLVGRYYNTALLLGQEMCSHQDSNSSSSSSLLNITSPSQLPCPEMAAGNSDVVSVRWDGLLTGMHVGESYQVAVFSNGKVRFWVHAWKMVDAWSNDSDKVTQHTGLWNFTAQARMKYPIRVEFQSVLQNTKRAFVQLLWRNTNSTEGFVPIPSQSLVPDITPSEFRRQKTQDNLAKG